MKSLVHIIKIEIEQGDRNNLRGEKLSNSIGIILKKHKNNIHELYLHHKIISYGPVYSILINNDVYHLCLSKSHEENLYCLYRGLKEHGITNEKGKSFKTFESFFTTHEKNIRFI